MTTPEHLENAMMHAELNRKSYMAYKVSDAGEEDWVVFNIKDKTYEQYTNIDIDSLSEEAFQETFFYDPSQ